MIYTIGNQKLYVPESGPIRKIRTPRQVVPWRDVAETCRTLEAICSTIKKPPCTIVDGIARAGFWGAVFRNRWPKCKLLLNENDATCAPVLTANFPKSKITSHDIKSWVPPKSDLSLLDFDHFTLRILPQWESVVSTWASLARYFIVADGACFGFKFGTMKHYGIKTAEEYFYLLDAAMKKLTDKRITVVSMFLNASTILLEDKKPKRIKFLTPADLYMSRGTKVYNLRPTVKKTRLGLLGK